MLDEHVQVRNEGQHACIEQAPEQLWRAARQQLVAAPRLAGRLDRWVSAIEADRS